MFFRLLSWALIVAAGPESLGSTAMAAAEFRLHSYNYNRLYYEMMVGTTWMQTPPNESIFGVADDGFLTHLASSRGMQILTNTVCEQLLTQQSQFNTSQTVKRGFETELEASITASTRRKLERNQLRPHEILAPPSKVSQESDPSHRSARKADPVSWGVVPEGTEYSRRGVLWSIASHVLEDPEFMFGGASRRHKKENINGIEWKIYPLGWQLEDQFGSRSSEVYRTIFNYQIGCAATVDAGLFAVMAKKAYLDILWETLVYGIDPKDVDVWGEPLSEVHAENYRIQFGMEPALKTESGLVLQRTRLSDIENLPPSPHRIDLRPRNSSKLIAWVVEKLGLNDREAMQFILDYRRVQHRSYGSSRSDTEGLVRVNDRSQVARIVRDSMLRARGVQPNAVKGSPLESFATQRSSYERTTQTVEEKSVNSVDIHLYKINASPEYLGAMLSEVLAKMRSDLRASGVNNPETVLKGVTFRFPMHGGPMDFLTQLLGKKNPSTDPDAIRVVEVHNFGSYKLAPPALEYSYSEVVAGTAKTPASSNPVLHQGHLQMLNELQLQPI